MYGMWALGGALASSVVAGGCVWVLRACDLALCGRFVCCGSSLCGRQPGFFFLSLITNRLNAAALRRWRSATSAFCLLDLPPKQAAQGGQITMCRVLWVVA